MMQILGLLGMFFDAAVVFVTTHSLLFRLTLAILCCPKNLYLWLRLFILWQYAYHVTTLGLNRVIRNTNIVDICQQEVQSYTFQVLRYYKHSNENFIFSSFRPIGPLGQYWKFQQFSKNILNFRCFFIFLRV